MGWTSLFLQPDQCAVHEDGRRAGETENPRENGPARIELVPVERIADGADRARLLGTVLHRRRRTARRTQRGRSFRIVFPALDWNMAHSLSRH